MSKSKEKRYGRSEENKQSSRLLEPIGQPESDYENHFAIIFDEMHKTCFGKKTCYGFGSTNPHFCSPYLINCCRVPPTCENPPVAPHALLVIATTESLQSACVSEWYLI